MGAADLLLDGLLERIRLLSVRDGDDLHSRLGGQEEFEDYGIKAACFPKSMLLATIASEEIQRRT